jgi:hypothetical protein
MMRTLVTICACCLLSFGATAEEPKKTRIFINQQCEDDSVGLRLAWKLKDAINGSSTMIAAEDVNQAAVTLYLVCLSPNEEDSGVISRHAYSLTLVSFSGPYEFDIKSGVASCGKNRVLECADDMAAKLDRAISEMRRAISSGKFRYPDK